MQIQVVSSIGIGNTLLSSFDNALKNAGVYNFNLLYLSSVIPKNASVVKREKALNLKGDIGDRLYVVQSNIRSKKPQLVIASGLGWYFLKNGGGVFVEHHAKGKVKVNVRQKLITLIETSIKNLCEFRGEKFIKDKLDLSIAITQVKRSPTCALTLAVYKSERW